MILALTLIHLLLSAPRAQSSSELSVRGKWFVDKSGRTVILRGVNLSGTSKYPPFLPLSPNTPMLEDLAVDVSNAPMDFSQLDRLESWGMNVVRVLFVWEAYEPRKGEYVDAYLDRMAELADQAWKRGMYTIIDMHQDSFSRFIDHGIGHGCGAGFPAWVTGNEPTSAMPRNCGSLWAVKTAVSVPMHHAFRDFYADRRGARSAFIEAWRRMAYRFKGHPGIIGYDLLNEPWAKEVKELAPLYNDTTEAIRKVDPTAIVFIEPHLFCVLGMRPRTNLPRPTYENFVYAPHFYDAVAAGLKHYYPGNPLTDLVFNRMPRLATKWQVPLLVGEFGAYAKTGNVEAYVDHQYELLDHALASATQWNFTPNWTTTRKDGWNDEDYSIVDSEGFMRKNFKIRAYPRLTAGEPRAFLVRRDKKTRQVTSVEFSWQHDPRLGQTELYLPRLVLFDHDAVRFENEGRALSCTWDRFEEKLICTSPIAGLKRVRVVRLK